MSAEKQAETVPFAEALDIDAELRELRSFVSVETRHAPTVRAINDLRQRIARAFGHIDLWCVEHCTVDARHGDCACSCGHPTSPVITDGGDER